jgi:hypothetical protein
MAKILSQGDVFVRQHPDGRYGAVRVLRIDGKSVMLSTSMYLSDSQPLASDGLLRFAVEQHRFSWKGQRAIKWMNGKPPANFVFAFNLPLNDEERRIECNSYGGRWDDDAGFEVYMEWRWENDREALEAEVQADRLARDEVERQKALAQHPKRMMAESDFWAVIGLLDWSKTGNDEAVIAPAINALAKQSKPSIRGFSERLAYCLYCLDTSEHARNIGSESYVDDQTHFSEDWFLYVRCAALANGKDFYEKARTNPQSMPKDLEFEALLSVSSAAWEAKTGDDFDYETGCSYESFSNLAGWSNSTYSKVPQ